MRPCSRHSFTSGYWAGLQAHELIGKTHRFITTIRTEGVLHKVAPENRLSKNAIAVGAISGGLMVAAAGLLPFLMVFHVITPTDGPIDTWGQRIFALSFGFLFLFTGLAILKQTTVAIVDTYDPDKEKTFIRRWLRYVFSRPSLKTLAASLLLYLTAVECFMGWIFDYAFPFGKGEDLIPIMGIEFIAIHSAAFLGLIAAIPAASWKGKGIKYAVFLLIAALYVALGVRNMGWIPSLGLIFLLGSKYAGYYFNPPRENEKFIIACRWLITFLTFMLAGVMMEDRTLKSIGTLPFGFFYFTALGTFELFDLYNVTCDEDLMEKWKANEKE